MNDEYLANSNKDSDFFIIKNNPEMIDASVIEDIKAEIRAMPKTYPFVNHLYTYVRDDDVIAIIDKHCGGGENE